jgi:2-oxoisovalerate dehydrogenase E2 component (dihydrolipoyl transacylase)
MVKSMTAAGQVPHFHYCDEVQMDALVELRQRLKGDPSLRGTKLTYMPFFLKARSRGGRRDA